MVDNRARCTCCNALYSLAIIGAVTAAAVYYIVFRCSLENEHEEMGCATIFMLSSLPKVYAAGMGFIALLANWGFVDFHTSAVSYLDIWDVNTTHLFTDPSITQVPVTVQESEIHGYTVYTYTPNELMGVSNQPVVIYFHGGGGVMLSPKYYDATMRYLSNKLKLKFIVPDYPKSPEVVFPTAHEACLSIVKYIFENTDTFSVDPKRISISGDSFGGHAALYVAFKWSELSYDEKFAPLLSMSLIYPWVQFVNLHLDSYHESVNMRVINYDYLLIALSFIIKGDLELVDLLSNSSLPLLSHSYQERQKECPELLTKLDWEPPASMVAKYSVYADKVLDPYATFLFQSDFSHLPPTLILSAGYDVLLSEGLLLRQRMQESGVPVEHHTFDKMFHGFFILTAPIILCSPVFDAYDILGEFLKVYIN